MANDQEVKYLVPGLERGLQLLLAFGEQHRDLTFAELHRLVDMPKATAYRVVQTLEYMGFLERNTRTNTFSLGMNVLRLGFEYIASLDVAQVGQPVIEQLLSRQRHRKCIGSAPPAKPPRCITALPRNHEPLEC